MTHPKMPQYSTPWLEQRLISRPAFPHGAQSTPTIHPEKKAKMIKHVSATLLPHVRRYVTSHYHVSLGMSKAMSP